MNRRNFLKATLSAFAIVSIPRSIINSFELGETNVINTDVFSVDFDKETVTINGSCSVKELVEFGKKYCPKMITEINNTVYIDGSLHVNGSLTG